MFEVHPFPTPCHCGGSFNCIIDTTIHHDWDSWFLSVIEKENPPQMICDKCYCSCVDYNSILHQLKEFGSESLKDISVESNKEHLNVSELPINCCSCDEALLGVINTTTIFNWWDYYKSRTGISLLCVRCKAINSAQYFRDNHIYFKDSKLNELKKKNQTLYNDIKSNKQQIKILFEKIDVLKSKNDLIDNEIKHNKKVIVQIKKEMGDKVSLNNDTETSSVKRETKKKKKN